MTVPLTGDEALAQIAAMRAAGADPENCSYEQAIRGLYQAAERLRHAVAASEHFKNIIAQTAPCPPFSMDVIDPLTDRAVTVSVPIGTIVRATSPDEETATKILQAFLALPMAWAAREYEACLRDMERYLKVAKAASGS